MSRKLRIILILTFAFIFGFCLIGSVFAIQPNGYGSVLDNNKGNVGDILVNTGNSNGNSDIGTWTNSSYLKGEKGDKGDTGATGEKGDTGATGEKGDTGATGEKGDTGATGKNGNTGAKGDKGKQGERGAKGEVGKGLKDRVNLMVGVQHEGEKWIQSGHVGYDVNNDCGILEIRFTRKIGESYTDKMIKHLQKQIDEIKVMRGTEVVDRFEEDDMEIVPTSTGIKIQKRNRY